MKKKKVPDEIEIDAVISSSEYSKKEGREGKKKESLSISE